jgi:hypothetical protein
MSYDWKGEKAAWVIQLCRMYAADLKALTDEQYTSGCGGASRSPQGMTQEVVAMCKGAINLLNGADTMDYSEAVASGINADVATRESAAEAVKAVGSELASAIQNASDETFAREITTPWGMQMSIGMTVNVCSSHIWYHDGQINYIQLISGDENVHWMD